MTWVWTLSKYDYVNPEALLRLMAGGAQLRAFPQPVLEEDCYKAATKMLDSVVPYRSNAYAWLQVAEFGFDSFQVRMRART